jgi:hypothetical protein
MSEAEHSRAAQSSQQLSQAGRAVARAHSDHLIDRTQTGISDQDL